MPEPVLRPAPQVSVVACPNCKHGINLHTAEPHKPVCSRDCACQWTPNHIAYFLMFGALTPAPGPKSVVRKPDGSWVDPDDWS